MGAVCFYCRADHTDCFSCDSWRPYDSCRFLIFGPVTGFIYNYVGIIIGSIVLFLLVKTYGRKFILLFVNDKTFYKYERRLETPGYEKLFIFVWHRLFLQLILWL